MLRMTGTEKDIVGLDGENLFAVLVAIHTELFGTTHQVLNPICTARIAEKTLVDHT